MTQAVQATFTRRKADLTLVPDVLAPAFYADLALGQRWRAFVKGLPIASQVGMTFVDVGGKLRPFLGPLADAVSGSLVLTHWNEVAGWT